MLPGGAERIRTSQRHTIGPPLAMLLASMWHQSLLNAEGEKQWMVDDNHTELGHSGLIEMHFNDPEMAIKI